MAIRDKVIYLDMDGVVCDLVSRVLQEHGYETPEDRATFMRERWPKGEYELDKVLGLLGPKEVWEKIDGYGWQLWCALDEYDDVGRLYKRLSQIAPVFFCSTPTWSADSLKGKLLWLQQRFGKSFRNYVFTPHKRLLAHSNALLIDDGAKNCDAFFEACGNALLVPRQWNRGVLPEGKTMVDYLLEAVAKVID